MDEKDKKPDQRRAKLESLGSFAGSIAHDLNNILTGVLGHVSFLRLSLPEDGAHRESLAAIEDGARRAALMSQQILDFSRDEDVAHRTVDLFELSQAAAKLLKGMLPETVKLQVKGHSHKHFVSGDETKLCQLVVNFAVNAIDALPNGGTIEIAIDETVVGQGGNDEIPPGRYVRLAVRDDGTGIPDAVRDRIFEPYFTTKSKTGTGLGLATVFSIVRTHGGAILVETEEGKGTCFQVLLPAVESIPRPQSKPLKPILPTGSESILVIDDEEAVRLVVQRSLEHLGYQVEVVENGILGIERYRQNINKYQLVILDMIMPQMPGDEVFFKLQEIDVRVPVLLASGYSSDSRMRAVLDAGGLGFIRKPFAIEDLAEEVRRCLDSARQAA